jgi:hypothetical protein
MKTTFKKLIEEIKPDYQYIYADFIDQEEEITNEPLEFVKLNKWMTNEEVFNFYEEKGLRPATFIEFANAIKNDPSLFNKWVFTLRDKNEFAAFLRDGDGRCVDVDRRGGWYGGWWFCGKKKEAFNKPQPALVEGEKEIIKDRLLPQNVEIS